MTQPNWSLPVEHVSWHDSRVRVDAQGTLIIQGVAPEDAGSYSCQAANEIGRDEETVTLYYTGTWVKGICRRGSLVLSPPTPPFLPVWQTLGYNSEHRVPVQVEVIF